MRAPDRVRATPRARRTARQRGITLAGVRGSGPGGRIVAADLIQAQPGTGTSAMRAAIARRTADSHRTIPHFHLRVEVDATALVRLKDRLTSTLPCTLTDLLLRSMAIALTEVPAANCVWQEQGLVRIPQPRVGLVVALEEGLLIPVVTPAAMLAAQVEVRARVVDQARRGVDGGSLPCATALSNLGRGRVDAVDALIPLGQSSILAVGRLAARPWVERGTFVVRDTLKLCLSADHRVLDGRPAADFLGRIADLLEHPEPLLEHQPWP